MTRYLNQPRSTRKDGARNHLSGDTRRSRQTKNGQFIPRLSAHTHPRHVIVDIIVRSDPPLPQSLLEFQRLLPDDTACATYLGKVRWRDGFACHHCDARGQTVPHRHAPRSLDPPRLPPSKRLNRGYGDAAQPCSAQRMVLGCVSGRQPGDRYAGATVPAPVWADPLRDSLRRPHCLRRVVPEAASEDDNFTKQSAACLNPLLTQPIQADA